MGKMWQCWKKVVWHLQICNGRFARVSELWPMGLLFITAGKSNVYVCVRACVCVHACVCVCVNRNINLQNINEYTVDSRYLEFQGTL